MGKIIILLLVALFFSCEEKLAVIPATVITETTIQDTDDPAIWVNKNNLSKSIVFGTGKDTDGAIYAYDLDGKIIEDKTLRGIQRPNNIDIRYDFKLNDSTFVDVLAFTEREKKQYRLFSIPDMRPLDNGGFLVFEDETNPEYQYPMGISLYKSPLNDGLYAIIGRKDGPSDGYLYQYSISSNSKGVSSKLVRKFGKYSGKKEIEAVAVDDSLGFVYYSDEMYGIRKYYAEPDEGSSEISHFGGKKFKRDIEGIAIADFGSGEGYIIVSNQQSETFNIFSRKDNKFIKEINLGTKQTDGCDVVTVSLNQQFRTGMFVAMNNERNFHFFDLESLGLPLLDK